MLMFQVVMSPAELVPLPHVTRSTNSAQVSLMACGPLEAIFPQNSNNILTRVSTTVTSLNRIWKVFGSNSELVVMTHFQSSSVLPTSVPKVKVISTLRLKACRASGG
jgi:hypothetical protein